MIMKTIYESILSSTNSGKVSFSEMIKNADIKNEFYKTFIHLEKMDFKTFLKLVDSKTMEKFFKYAWTCSKKTIGGVYFIFKDGIFSTEISKPPYYSTSTTHIFRTIFIHNEDIKHTTAGDIYYQLYAYNEYNKKYSEKTEHFASCYGDRLPKIMTYFISYLKEHYDILYTLKW